ncbi:hypothetical protein PoB_005172800 [Plakobranchus ocellatus]|uniref:Secreted protein n=1 Tax=Plakobranchus ocellatus TaxID=259542 RepID=A0AAV4C012_9GAST|nr:hypothetical protein PoB_005172800 [Plakobranchus ocellatus]
MLIRVGRSSAFLLLATEAAPRAASVQGFFATSGCGEGSDVFFGLVMGYVLRFSSRAPRPPQSPTRGTCCAAFQRCVRATLELYSQQRVWDLYRDWNEPYSKKNDQPIGQRGSALPSRLRRRKWPRRHVDESQTLLPGRHHLNLQDPPLPPYGSHLTANKAPTLWGWASQLFPAPEGYGG